MIKTGTFTNFGEFLGFESEGLLKGFHFAGPNDSVKIFGFDQLKAVRELTDSEKKVFLAKRSDFMESKLAFVNRFGSE